jgi:thiol-disulfide isomerase/thioredoxin
MQLNKLNAGMLIVTIGVGMMFYTYIEFDVFDRSTPADAALEPDSEDSRSKQSVFNFFKSPQAIPELRFMNRKNREITLEAFRGSFVLLNIWATWCAPCREEMPALDRLQEKLGGPGFQVLALSIDEAPPSKIENFYKELEIESLYVYHDPTSKAFLKLNAPGIPASFLIDREGRGIGYVIGPVEWDSPAIVKEIRSYISPVEENN